MVQQSPSLLVYSLGDSSILMEPATLMLQVRKRGRESEELYTVEVIILSHEHLVKLGESGITMRPALLENNFHAGRVSLIFWLNLIASSMLVSETWDDQILVPGNF
jgi:hypothetical protein